MSAIQVILSVLIALGSMLRVGAGSIPVAQPELLRLPVPETARCVAANESGTRFLIVETDAWASSRTLQPYLIDADGSNRTPLSLTLGEEGTKFKAQLAQILKLSGVDELDALAQEHGDESEYLLSILPWSWTHFLDSSEQCLVLRLSGMGDMLIDAESGHVRIWVGSISLSPDGRVTIYQPTNEFVSYDPSTGAESVALISGGDAHDTPAGRTLSGGGQYCLRISYDGTTPSIGVFSIAYVDANGAESGRVSDRAYASRSLPNSILYSESTGTGIAYDMQSILVPPIIFHTDTDTVRVLWLDDPDATQARERPYEELFDESGHLTESSTCMIYPFGLSSDGRMALLYEVKNGVLYSMNMRTLKMRKLTTAADLAAQYNENGVEFLGLNFASLGWNGNAYLAGWRGVPGHVVRIDVG